VVDDLIAVARVGDSSDRANVPSVAEVAVSVDRLPRGRVLVARPDDLVDEVVVVADFVRTSISSVIAAVIVLPGTTGPRPAARPAFPGPGNQ
jgi:hypothetical protein